MKTRVVLLFSVIGVLWAVPTQARNMADVMMDCDGGSDFVAYTACIRSTYEKKGNHKHDGDVYTFYALLDEITDAYKHSLSGPDPMTISQAKGNVYRAWQSTIGASNNGQPAHVCNMHGNLLDCH